MSARAIAIHGNEKSGERRANLEIKSECPALHILDSCNFSCWTGPYTYYVCFLKEGEGRWGLGGICRDLYNKSCDRSSDCVEDGFHDFFHNFS